MPTEADRNRVADRIVELTKTVFHGNSSYWKCNDHFPPFWIYYPVEPRRDTIVADLGDGYETKTWLEMDDEDKAAVLTSYIKMDGYNKEQFARVVGNIVRDEGTNPDAWFDGLEFSAAKPAERNDFGSTLAETRRRAQYRQPDDDLEIDR